MNTWRPDAHLAPLLVALVPDAPPLDHLLAVVGAAADRLDAPVQALRADRVLSPTHLRLARLHAERARAAGRARASEPALEMLLFAACSRQIQTALADLGAPRDGGLPVLVVAMPHATRPDTTLHDALNGNGLTMAEWRPADAARAWWASRLGLPATAPIREVEVALLAAMAALAVAKQ